MIVLILIKKGIFLICKILPKIQLIKLNVPKFIKIASPLNLMLTLNLKIVVNKTRQFKAIINYLLFDRNGNVIITWY